MWIISALFVVAGVFVLVSGVMMASVAKTSIHEIGAILALLLGTSLIGIGFVTSFLARIASLLRDIHSRISDASPTPYLSSVGEKDFAPSRQDFAWDGTLMPIKPRIAAVLAIVAIGAAVLVIFIVGPQKELRPDQPTTAAPPVYPRESGTGSVMASRFDYQKQGNKYTAHFNPPLGTSEIQMAAAMRALLVDAFGVQALKDNTVPPAKRGDTWTLIGNDGHTYLFIPVKQRELTGMTFWSE